MIKLSYVIFRTIILWSVTIKILFFSIPIFLALKRRLAAK